MEDKLPQCPECQADLTYEDGDMYICPACFYEWTKSSHNESIQASIVKDAVGNTLSDGDSVTVIRDLKVKGASDIIKQGTKVKHIRLIEPEDGHDIDCKIKGFGQIKLKSSVVKKID